MTRETAADLISVLLPVRAPAPWLDECLASLRAQTEPAWELVAVVDGPDRQIESTLGAFGARQVVIQQSRGLPYALNRGLDHCRGSCIARLDADDLCRPERLTQQRDFLEAHPTVVAVGSWVQIIDEHGVSGEIRREPNGKALRKAMLWKNHLVHPSVMMRSAAVRAAGGYNQTALRVEDYELWLRLGADGVLANIPRVLLDYRMHSGQEWRRPIPPESAAAVGAARRAFARAHGASELASAARHLYWTARRSLR